MKRITILAAAGALVATPAVGAWAAYASNGSDDPVTHVQLDDHGRHHHGHRADDAVRGAATLKAHQLTHHVRHGEPEPGDDKGGRGEVEPGDDHGGQGEVEPGDDNGGHGEAEPGDDHGGQGEVEPGDDNGGNSGSGSDDSGSNSGSNSGSGSGSDDGGHHGGDDGGHHGGGDD